MTENQHQFAADNLTDVVFDRITLPQTSECLDGAFLRRVTFSHFKAVAGDSGVGTSRAGCITITYDAATLANYPAIVPFTTTDHVTFDDTVNISNFTAGIQILIISGADLSGNGTGTRGAGLLINAASQTASEVISNIIVKNTLFNNNTNAAISTKGPHITAGSFAIGQNLLVGANQTTGYDATTMAEQSGRQ